MEDMINKKGRLDDAIHQFNETINGIAPGQITTDTLKKILSQWSTVTQAIAAKEKQEVEDLTKVFGAMGTNVKTIADLVDSIATMFSDGNMHDIYAGDVGKGVAAQASNVEWLGDYVEAKAGKSMDMFYKLQDGRFSISRAKEDMKTLNEKFPGRKTQEFQEIYKRSDR